ncbi:transketolase family protein [Aeromicrobium sp. CF4.19]|uniref:transketolase family protein n=1 Tax=Aeromicrobium sp. CF4.19 TaxID=3373082 RepID=UPI003EE6528E
MTDDTSLSPELRERMTARRGDGTPMTGGSWHIPSMLTQSSGLLELGRDLGQMIEDGRPLVVTTPDLAFSNGLWGFRDKYPERFLQMGISEQNMVSVAAGLATTGVEPYVAGFSCFTALLCIEQIRTDIAYTQLPVKIIGHHAGISFGFYGTSHHATEDVGILRTIANLTVVTPADSVQMRQALLAYADHPLPVYFRMGRGREPIVYEEDSDFTPDRAIVHSTGADLAIITGGTSLHPTLQAAERLRADGVDVGVVDMHTVKPIDIDAVLTAAEQSAMLMTVEEHNVIGGLGGAVAEVLAEAGSGVRLHRHGIRDEYVVIGPPTHLYEHYRLDGPGVEAEARDLLGGRISPHGRR